MHIMTSVDALISQSEIFPWSDNFATGIEVIDEQHRKLVTLLNKLAGHMAYGSEWLTLHAVFDELADYAHYHFQTEEGVWNKYLGDDQSTRSHQQIHRDFVEQVARIRATIGTGGDDEAIEKTVNFLTHWLAFHILEEDTYMARVVLGLQNGQALPDAKATATEHMNGVAHELIRSVMHMYDSLSSRTLTLLREVGRRHRVEEKLQLAGNIIERSADGIFITDIHGLITDVNPAFCETLKRPRAELLGQAVDDVMPGLFGFPAGQAAWAGARANGHWAGEANNRKPDGEMETIWLTLSTVNDETLQTQHFVGVLSSLSQLLERHQALEAAANHDALTGLPNRRLLADRLRQAMELAKRNRKLLAVCYVDLDGFKSINDRLGHAAGDEVLRVVAQRMKAALRGADTVARMGGDEFVLLLGNLSHVNEATKLLHLLMFELGQPMTVLDQQVQVALSMGVTVYPTDPSSPDELLAHADKMLYTAKADGKACLRLYSAD
jgi:diguanylate cyclase (GGDEF)-like protein/hemerythrin-like metal-binding protein/PAS domain S-box-containing protein